MSDTGRPSVVIAYAYGASDWKTVDVRRAFRDNLAGIDVDVEAVDWRPFLPSPQAHYLRFVRNRDAEAPCDAEAVTASVTASVMASAPASLTTSALAGASGASSRTPRTARSPQTSRTPRTYPARSDLAATAAERAAVAEGRREGRLSLDPLTRPAMRVVHHAMVDNAGITMADVLGYLRDPAAVIGPAAERLLEIRRGAGGRPVVAVGLSLGGIILVDTLATLLRDAARPEADRRPAALLVTVGSQSAALRAMGVMPSAPRDAVHPVLFTPWLNVWHEHDYLSYPVGAVFEHLGDVCDRRAVQRGAFPGVHSGYLNRSSRFFDHLGEAIRARFGG
ncbi:MAG: hypothetical protein A2V84_01945 [Chloroflexi bacterium RBG_16_70_13]|nr:MAG: hypothetical protein A2V84_01945 [Chloroflexi bacterium RBG_16_70_13]